MAQWHLMISWWAFSAPCLCLMFSRGYGPTGFVSVVNQLQSEEYDNFSCSVTAFEPAHEIMVLIE